MLKLALIFADETLIVWLIRSFDLKRFGKTFLVVQNFWILKGFGKTFFGVSKRVAFETFSEI